MSCSSWPIVLVNLSSIGSVNEDEAVGTYTLKYTTDLNDLNTRRKYKSLNIKENCYDSKKQ